MAGDRRMLTKSSNMFLHGAVLAWAGLLAGCAAGKAHRSVALGLQSDDPSQRIQACIEAVRLEDRKSLPLLVERLEDGSADVRLFAVTALKKMTGQALGYRYYAPPAERADAVRRWREWLKSRVAADKGS